SRLAPRGRKRFVSYEFGPPCAAGWHTSCLINLERPGVARRPRTAPVSVLYPEEPRPGNARNRPPAPGLKGAAVMKSLLAGAALPALLLLTAAGPASALTPKVNDEAGFFSPAAVEKANDVIDEIRHKYHKDLLIETFKTVPSDQADRVKNMSRQDRDRF